MKYNFDLDMNSINSNSAILNRIEPNSKVLEFGPAYGRMTKYLKEQLNCDVTIVELDRQAGKSASQFATKSFIGKVGNIEKYYWYHDLKNEKFDYIIFADVLEHLYDPKHALELSKDLLNTNGKIWISIPNVAHNSIIIDLINNKFQYREVGLLDKTHIRFFTSISLQDMIDDCNLIVFEKQNLINTVENTEFKNSYDDIHPDIAFFIKNKRNSEGEIYQFVWGLCK